MNRSNGLKLAGLALGLLAIGALIALWPKPAPEPASTAPAGQLSPAQIKQLGIETVAATATTSTIIGTASGQIILPPDARVGVAIPFAGEIADELEAEFLIG